MLSKMKKNIISSEFRLLLDLLTKNVEPAEIDSSKWLEIFKLSQAHQVSPLIYNNYKSTIPSEILPMFESSYLETLANNMRLWHELCNIRNLLKESNISIIPLKGIMFADLLYKDIGLRPMSDIDILLHKKDIEKASTIISTLGYRPFLDKRPLSYWLEYLHHITFTNQENKTCIELHWAFAPPRPYALDLSSVWEGARYYEIEKTTVLGLAPEDMLLSLTAEICKIVHNLETIHLKNLYDFELILRTYGKHLNIKYLSEKMKEWNLYRSFYFIIQLTTNVLKTKWPSSLQERASMNVVERKIIQSAAAKLTRRSRFSAYLLLFLLTDTAKGKMTLILQRLTTLFYLLRASLQRSLTTR